MSRTKGREFAFWLAYTAIAPVMFIGLTFILGAYVVNLEHPFGEFFGGGDLFPLAALLLLSVAADIRIESVRRDPGYFSTYSEPIFVILAFGAVLAYGGMKVHVLDTKNVAANLVPFARLSVNFIGYALVHTSIVKASLIFGREHD
jgi:hypothetical protein